MLAEALAWGVLSLPGQVPTYHSTIAVHACLSCGYFISISPDGLGCTAAHMRASDYSASSNAFASSGPLCHLGLMSATCLRVTMAAVVMLAWPATRHWPHAP